MVALDIVEINDKKYFMDNRLQEYRAIDNPHEVITFDEQEYIDDCLDNWDNQKENCRNCKLSFICFANESNK